MYTAGTAETSGGIQRKYEWTPWNIYRGVPRKFPKMSHGFPCDSPWGVSWDVMAPYDAFFFSLWSPHHQTKVSSSLRMQHHCERSKPIPGASVYHLARKTGTHMYTKEQSAKPMVYVENRHVKAWSARNPLQLAYNSLGLPKRLAGIITGFPPIVCGTRGLPRESSCFFYHLHVGETPPPTVIRGIPQVSAEIPTSKHGYDGSRKIASMPIRSVYTLTILNLVHL